MKISYNIIEIIKGFHFIYRMIINMFLITKKRILLVEKLNEIYLKLEFKESAFLSRKTNSNFLQSSGT